MIIKIPLYCGANFNMKEDKNIVINGILEFPKFKIVPSLNIPSLDVSNIKSISELINIIFDKLRNKIFFTKSQAMCYLETFLQEEDDNLFSINIKTESIDSDITYEDLYYQQIEDKDVTYHYFVLDINDDEKTIKTYLE